jgi:peptidoglycan hydrolase CwlO-like protein
MDKSRRKRMKLRITATLLMLMFSSTFSVYADNPATQEYVDQKFGVIQQEINALNNQMQAARNKQNSGQASVPNTPNSQRPTNNPNLRR